LVRHAKSVGSLPGRGTFGNLDMSWSSHRGGRTKTAALEGAVLTGARTLWPLPQVFHPFREYPSGRAGLALARSIGTTREKDRN